MNGVPEFNVAIPFSCQPPKIARTVEFALSGTRGPQLALATNRWRASNSDGPYSAPRSNGFCARSFSPASGFRRRAREVHRRQLVLRARQPVRDVEPDAARIAPRQADLAGFVVRVRDVRQHRDGREIAGAAVRRAVGVDAPAVGVLRRRARAVHRRVRSRRSAECARPSPPRSGPRAWYLSNSDALHADVPVLRVGRLRRRVDREHGGRPHERVRRGIGVSQIRVLEVEALRR